MTQRSKIDVKNLSFSLAKRVEEFVRRELLWQEDAHLLLAVSGGADSVMLLDLLHTRFAKDERLRLSVAHIHHGLRPEADEDAAFVESLANRYGLAFVQKQVDVLGRVADGDSIEEAARDLRYAALDDLAGGLHADRIVTGHTADDQAETVLMRFLRGAGLTGLAGIPPRRDNIVRPLLPVWRSEIEEYIRFRGLSYRTDASNFLPDFTRNRLRMELLPLLEKEYAPRLGERLCSLAELARQDNQALDELTERYFDTFIQQAPGGIALMPCDHIHRAVQRRLWRRAISEICGSLENIGFEHIEAIEQLPPGGEVDLPGVRVFRESGRLVFLPSGEGLTPHIAIQEQNLPVPGRICLPEAGCCIATTIHENSLPIESGDVAVLDAGAVNGQLTLRSWLPGDYFRPLGAGGRRKLQDIFVDAQVPRRLRERIPVVSDSDGIIWLAGFRIADRVKIVPSTSRTIRLQVEWEFNPWEGGRPRPPERTNP